MFTTSFSPALFTAQKSRKNLTLIAQKRNFSSKSITPKCSFSLKSDEVVYHKLNVLVAEFRSLSEPIDRVKRLLHYAAMLSPFDESARVPENRVTGCASQVWVEAKLDEFGRMRFKADSDSEITKGFCYCLVWLMDGLEAEEALRVRVEDLGEVNVGVYGKVSSRVNGWYALFKEMKKRTEVLVSGRRKMLGLEGFVSGNLIAGDGTCVNGDQGFVEEEGCGVLISV